MSRAETTYKVLEFIKHYAKTEACLPTCDEIRDGMGFKSKSSAKNQIDRLIEEGSLEARPGKTPAYRLVNWVYTEKTEEPAEPKRERWRFG